MDDSLSALTQSVRAFAEARDWSQFHTPKNLAMALAGEVGELVAELQWHDSSDPIGPESKQRLAAECADVLIYLVRLSDVTGIDLLSAADQKLSLNEERYPAEQARGRSSKYYSYEVKR